MGEVYPPYDFTSESYTQSEASGLPLKAAPPLLLDEKTQVLSIAAANESSSGVVNTVAQSFSGIKNFAALPTTAGGAPLNSNQLATKGYVDSLLALNISWAPSINLGFLAAPPGAPANADRFIATATAGGFTQNYIYTYDSGVPGWAESIPAEGWALYNQSNTAPFANSCVIFSDALIWTNLGGALLHSALQDVPVGSLTHTQINSYLNQSVQTSATPSFAALTLKQDAVPHLTLSRNNPAINATLSLDAGGDLTLRATGSDIILHPDDRLAVQNTTLSSSTTTGCATFAGGVGVAGSLYANRLVGVSLDLISAASMPLLSEWYRLSAPAGTLLYTVEFGHAPYGNFHATYYGSPAGVNQLTVYFNDVIGTVGARALLARETSTGLYHAYIAATGLYTFSVRSAANITFAIVDCGPVGSPPNDLVPGDYTIVKDSATDAAVWGAWVTGYHALVSQVAPQLQIRYDAAGVNNCSLTVDAAGDLTINASGNDLNFHSSDRLHVLNTTASTDANSGAMVLAGGLGIAGDVWCAGTIHGTYSGNIPTPLIITSTVLPQLTVAYDGTHKLDVSVSAAGALTLAPTLSPTTLNSSLIVGNGTAGSYQRMQMGGGNSYGYWYSSYPRHSDGVHQSYNYYANEAGTEIIANPAGSTSRVSSAYGYVELCTGPVNTPPIPRLWVDNTQASITLPTSVLSTTTPQLRVMYDGTYYAAFSVNNAGYLSISANNYTTWSSTGTFTGGAVYTANNVAIRARRTGNTIMIELDPFSAVPTGSYTGFLYYSTVVPALYRPPTYITTGLGVINDNDALYAGGLTITSDGLIYLESYKSTTGTFALLNNSKFSGAPRPQMITFTV